MPLIHKTIPGLFNGVSQQPAALRLDTQCSLQENASSDLVEGLVKRPGTEYVATLSSNVDQNSFMHIINRDVSERYQIIITDDPTEPIEIFTIDGLKCTVIYEEGTKDYIITSNPKQDLRTITIADYTIITNRTKLTSMKSTISSLPKPMSLGYVKRGYPEITYTIKVYNDVNTLLTTQSYTTPVPGSQGVTTIKTDDIASELSSQLSTALGATDWAIAALGSVVVLENLQGENFRIECFDSYGDSAMVTINSSVQKFSDLPPVAPDGYVVTVEGDNASNFDNFYVKYLVDKNIWEETVALKDEKDNILQNDMEPSTLPHRLIRTSYNEFTLKPILWASRKIGDLESAPVPSFIDNAIKDVFFFKNRLGFLSGENIIMSRASEYFDFFPSTATDVLDSDPIDVAVSATRVAILEHATPFSSSLLLFSDQQQFTAASSQGVLTPSTIVIDSSTYFEASTKCAPVSAGPNLYFVVPSGRYSTMREYFVQPDTLNNDAADITAHVPRYLPSNIIKLAASSAKDFIFALSEDEPNNIYVYKYFWQGETKVQSSWSKWIFDDEVLNIEVLDNYLYMVIKKESQIHLAKLNMDASAETGNLDFRIHLDKMVEVQGVYDGVTDTTTFILPYTDTADNFNLIDSQTGNILTEVIHPQADIFEVKGNWTSTTYYIGKTFVERYVFSQLYLKNDQKVALVQGHLKLANLVLSYHKTGIFSVIVKPEKRPEIKQTFTGVIVGVSKIGKPSIVSGEKSFSIDCDSKQVEIELQSDNYLPCKIQIAAYAATFDTKAIQFY